jgi:hypothetical protein
MTTQSGTTIHGTAAGFQAGTTASHYRMPAVEYDRPAEVRVHNDRRTEPINGLLVRNRSAARSDIFAIDVAQSAEGSHASLLGAGGYEN